jgi:hypothetical protein
MPTNKSNRTEHIQVRVSLDELELLKSYAESKGLTVSEVIRDYIKRLPKSTKKRTPVK